MRHTLDSAISGYLAVRESQRYAANTQRNDERALRSFMAAVGNIQVANVEPRHIDTFFALVGSRLSPGTINMYNSSLRSFFKWCRQARMMRLDSDPMVGRRFLKTLPKQKVRIPADRFGDLLDAAPHPTDRAVIALGLYLFLRQGEIQTLRVGDVDLARGEVNVSVWKTKQRDVMPICEELDTELRRWLTYYSSQCDVKPEHYLVPGKTAPRFTGTTEGLKKVNDSELCPTRPVSKVFVTVKRVLVAAGFYVTGECGHMLRRSGARALYDRLSSEGHDRAARRAQAMLHHSALVQTERYLGIDIDVKERNDILRGKPMFPKAANVVEIRKASEA